ncbi:MAG: hypothetical protein JXQ90_16225 [Cyclobacteriaceae bacterium]
MKQSIFIVCLLLSSYAIMGQDGRHLSINYDIEINNWKTDALPKTGATVGFFDIQYFHYADKFFNGSLFDVHISGLMSSLQKNNNTITSDGVTQITNTNIVSLNSLHFLNSGDFKYGFVWGIDFTSKYITEGVEVGGWDTGETTADISGLAIPLGVGAQYATLDDQLYIDGRLAYYFVYSSSYGDSGGFVGKGPQAKVRARYYIGDFLFASGQVFYEGLKHKPANETDNTDPGKATTTRLMFGIGVQF